MTTAIVGGTIVTFDDAASVHRDGVILIDRDEIEYVGPRTGSRTNLDGLEIIDATNRIIIPGFVNAHTHSSQSLLRGGISHSRGLYDWVLDVLLKGLAHYTTDDFRIATQLYAAEAISSGVTTVLTNEEPLTAIPDDGAAAVIDAFTDSGLRVVYALMFRDAVQAGAAAHVPRAKELPRHAALAPTFDLLERLQRRYHNTAQGRIAIWPSPASTATVSQEAFRLTDQWAADHGVGWTMHLAEVEGERVMREITPVQYLDRSGALTPRLLGTHAVHVDDEDIALLARRGVSVATNPVSNSYLASGVAPLRRLLDAGITVGLGTDDANCNDSVNPLSDLKYCALLHRAVSMDPAIISPYELMRMATRGGAEAMGLGDRIGSLAPGKQADLALIRTDFPQMTPMHDPVATLVFQAYGGEIDTVFVGGRIVMEHRHVRFAPELSALLDTAQKASTRIIETAGIECPIDPHLQALRGDDNVLQ